MPASARDVGRDRGFPRRGEPPRHLFNTLLANRERLFGANALFAVDETFPI